jgi:C-terminal binding protein
MHHVIISDFLSDNLEPEQRILDRIASVEALDAHGEADLIGRIEEADAIMMYHTFHLKRRTIERLRHCKIIVRCGVGVDNIDHAFAAERGIPVANVPDYGTEDVADTAIGMVLTLARGIHQMNSSLQAGKGAWSYTQVVPLRRLRGTTIGIVGLGRIGTATAIRAKALGMNVVFYDPFKPDGYDKALGIRRAWTLEELLAQSHVLTLHCPLTEQTRSMIGAAALGLMPHGSFLINTARGEVVDIDAVVPALVSGQLEGVGIDVLPVEPPVGIEPLIAAWKDAAHPAHHRIIINPHAAFYSEEGLMDMRIKGAEACRRALTGEPIRNVVNQPRATS